MPPIGGAPAGDASWLLGAATAPPPAPPPRGADASPRKAPRLAALSAGGAAVAGGATPEAAKTAQAPRRWPFGSLGEQ